MAQHGGAEPTQGDIEDDETMRLTYLEYLRLQQELKSSDEAASKHGKDAVKKRKAALKEIEKWKKLWKAQFGVDATEADMRGDGAVRKLIVELERDLADFIPQNSAQAAAAYDGFSPREGVLPPQSPTTPATVQRVQEGSTLRDSFAQFSRVGDDDHVFATEPVGHGALRRLPSVFGRRRSSVGTGSLRPGTSGNSRDGQHGGSGHSGARRPSSGGGAGGQDDDDYF